MADGLFLSFLAKFSEKSEPIWSGRGGGIGQQPRSGANCLAHHLAVGQKSWAGSGRKQLPGMPHTGSHVLPGLTHLLSTAALKHELRWCGLTGWPALKIHGILGRRNFLCSTIYSWKITGVTRPSWNSQIGVYVNVCVCSRSWCFVTPQHHPVFLKGHRNNPQLDVSCHTDFPEISMRPTYPVPLILLLSSKSLFHLPSVTSSARKENKRGKAKRNRGPQQNWGQKFSLTKTEDWKTLGETAPWSQDTYFLTPRRELFTVGKDD